MVDVWLVAVPAVLVAIVLIVLPGLVVTLAGFGARTVAPHLLAPALSVGIIAIAANVAPLL